MKLRTMTLAMATLGICGVANAAMSAAECAGENASVPCEQSGWQVGGQYLYVQPTGDQLYSNLNSQSRWASGFRVEGGYHFGTGNDVTLNWTYFSKGSRRHVLPFTSPLLEIDEIIDEEGQRPDVGVGVNLGVNLEEGENERNTHVIADNFPSGPFLSAERVKSTFNAVNLEFGQMAYWGEHVRTRLHAGLQYASIVRNRSHYNSTATATRNFSAIGHNFIATQTSAVDFEQKFNGMGPRVGIDTFYTLGNSNFSLVGKAAVAILAADTRVRKGTARLNLREQMIKNNQAPVQLTAINADFSLPNTRTRTLTAGLEAKLGFEYAHPLAAGDLVFEGGYQWVAYPQSLLVPSAANFRVTDDSIDEPDVFVSPTVPLGLGIPGNLNNFGYHGFYVGLRWKGNLA